MEGIEILSSPFSLSLQMFCVPRALWLKNTSKTPKHIKSIHYMKLKLLAPREETGKINFKIKIHAWVQTSRLLTSSCPPQIKLLDLHSEDPLDLSLASSFNWITLNPVPAFWNLLKLGEVENLRSSPWTLRPYLIWSLAGVSQPIQHHSCPPTGLLVPSSWLEYSVFSG